MNLNISISFDHAKTYRVKLYTEMLDWYDINKIQGDLPPSMRSNFGYVQVWIPGLGTSNITTHCTITRPDIDKLIGLQKPEGDITVANKMNWLVYEGDFTRPYWGGDWRTASEIEWGVLLFTNQLVRIDKIQTMRVKVPNSSTTADLLMGRLVTFRKSDWGKTYNTDPHIIHHGTGVRGKDNTHNETPRGEVFSPLWSPEDFDFRPVSSDPSFKKEYWAYMDTLKVV